jgi:hypothetical protein
MKLSFTPTAVTLVAGWIGIATAEIPAVCYGICNNALLEGNRVGWSDATLCAQDSVFKEYKFSCFVCCLSNPIPEGIKFEGTQFERVTKWC